MELVGREAWGHHGNQRWKQNQITNSKKMHLIYQSLAVTLINSIFWSFLEGICLHIVPIPPIPSYTKPSHAVLGNRVPASQTLVTDG